MSSRPANDLNGRHVLLTGHRGFIGSSLLEALQAHGCTVTVFPGDVAAPDAWHALDEKFDFVLHLAAVENEPNVERELSVNALSVLNLARRIAALRKKPKVIFTSSVNIWGSRTDTIIDEQTIDAPASVWSAHKLLAENYLRAYREFGVETVILRLPNVFGVCANKNAMPRSAVNRAIDGCVRSRTLTIYANKDCIRDYLDVSDLTAMFLQVIRHFDELSRHAKVIIGSGRCMPIIAVWRAIACQYETLTGMRVEIREDASKLDAFAMRSYATSNALASRIIGCEPKISLEEGLRTTARYLIDAQERKSTAARVEIMDG
jgi:nucleoside-diphosphate-sugar epimerase